MVTLPTRGAPQDVKDYFARVLRKSLKERDLTQSDFARQLDTPRDNVSGWINARVFPRPDQLESIAEKLGVTVGSMLPSEMEPRSDDSPVYEFRHNRKTGNIRVVIDMDIPPDEADQIFQIVRKIDT